MYTVKAMALFCASHTVIIGTCEHGKMHHERRPRYTERLIYCHRRVVLHYRDHSNVCGTKSPFAGKRTIIFWAGVQKRTLHCYEQLQRNHVGSYTWPVGICKELLHTPRRLEWPVLTTGLCFLWQGRFEGVVMGGSFSFDHGHLGHL